ncbi:hypothetical protein BU23DRAFT_124613 [Bimuria novae-zelandiae CBS 107.79]|uniref:Uncharacterized protein n=1 Tax=Bimuria novae-zelandiae CBS 107.79 TaxID=1447943 RepID=A0A6A5V9E2_9PLEO|nr:hypothetical protein BU23DRAFT_124613 [Bimuria novae-zelandiae CBS 107.79]
MHPSLSSRTDYLEFQRQERGIFLEAGRSTSATWCEDAFDCLPPTPLPCGWIPRSPPSHVFFTVLWAAFSLVRRQLLRPKVVSAPSIGPTHLPGYQAAIETHRDLPEHPGASSATATPKQPSALPLHRNADFKQSKPPSVGSARVDKDGRHTKHPCSAMEAIWENITVMREVWVLKIVH